MSIKDREPVMGAPHAGTPELARFYDTMLARVQDIFDDLNQDHVDADLKRTVLLMLFNGCLFCGTARFNETLSAHTLLRPPALTPEALHQRENMIFETLLHFRRRCFVSALPDNDQHTYNAYMFQIGEHFGAANAASAYEDPLVPEILDKDVSEFEDRFYDFYNPFDIVQYAARASKDKTQIPSGILPALLSDYGPAQLTKVQTNRLHALRVKRDTNPLTPQEAVKLGLYNRHFPESDKDRNDFEALKRKDRTRLTAQEQTEINQLDEINTQVERYQDTMVDPNGVPTQDGIHYLLLALGVIKPVGLYRDQPFLPIIESLIRRRIDQFSRVHPDSEQHEKLALWLSGILET